MSPYARPGKKLKKRPGGPLDMVIAGVVLTILTLASGWHLWTVGDEGAFVQARGGGTVFTLSFFFFVLVGIDICLLAVLVNRWLRRRRHRAT